MKKIPRNFCFLDLETTGFDPEKDSIIEISFIIKTPAGQEIDRFDQVVFPDKSELSSFVSNLTGITQEELNQSGKNFPDLLETVREKIGNSVIVGHNIDFDINFLLANGLENLAENPRIDTHELARIFLPEEESYALEVLAHKYQMKHENAHRAMSDVQANILFFDFILEKIQKIPAKFLTEIKSVLENKTDWYAKNIVLQNIGKNKVSTEEIRKKEFIKKEIKSISLEIPDKFWENFAEFSPQTSIFIKEGDNLKSAQLLKKITEKQEKSLVITTKLDYFDEFKQFPSPQVILDPEKLNNFAKSREKMTDSETTFWLQAKFREFLGLRGKNFFNLFFQQRDYWNEVCLSDENHPIFREIIEERKNFSTLVIHPYTFLKLIDLDVFKERTLIIDESEVFANDLLFAVSKNWSFLDSLNSNDEDESTAAQFWITNFCREVIEEKNQRAISPFPEKILLNKTEKFPVFADGIKNFPKIKNKTELQEILLNSREKTVRWATYSPQNGNLTIGSWHPDDWRDLKNKLAKFAKIFFHRHEIDDSFSFFRIFIGVSDGKKLNPDFLQNKYSLHIPDDLISVKSPDFNTYTVHKIQEIFAEISVGEVLPVNFSSISTLKNVFDELSLNTDENEKIYGESASGGTSKILNLITQNSAKKQLLLFKNITTPEFKNFNIQKLIVQKFIFNPPHPLLEEMERVMKISGLSFWDIWTLPQVIANFSRVIGTFPDLKEVIFLDARENSRWGKTILRELF